MADNKTLVLALLLIAILWRISTWWSFAAIGYIGISENEEGHITAVSAASPAEASGIRAGDQIISVEGMERDGRPFPGQQLVYTIERDGSQQIFTLKAARYFTTPILGIMGLLIVILGFWIFRKHRNLLSFIFFLYCFVMCIHWGGYPQVAENAQGILVRIYILISIFLGSLILHFALTYPGNLKLSSSKFFLTYFPGIIGLVLFVVSFFVADLITTFQALEALLVTLFALIGGIILFRKYFKTPRNDRHAIGIGVICSGILLANLPYMLSEFLPFMDFGGQIEHLIYRLFFIFQPIAFAMGINRLSRNKVLH